VLRIFVRKAVMKIYEPAKKGGHRGIRTHKEVKDKPQGKVSLQNLYSPSYKEGMRLLKEYKTK